MSETSILLNRMTMTTIKSEKVKWWIYAAAGGGGGALILIIIVICVFCCRRKKKSSEKQRSGGGKTTDSREILRGVNVESTGGGKKGGQIQSQSSQRESLSTVGVAKTGRGDPSVIEVKNSLIQEKLPIPKGTKSTASRSNPSKSTPSSSDTLKGCPESPGQEKKVCKQPTSPTLEKFTAKEKSLSVRDNSKK